MLSLRLLASHERRLERQSAPTACNSAATIQVSQRHSRHPACRTDKMAASHASRTLHRPFETKGVTPFPARSSLATSPSKVRRKSSRSCLPQQEPYATSICPAIGLRDGLAASPLSSSLPTARPKRPSNNSTTTSSRAASCASTVPMTDRAHGRRDRRADSSPTSGPMPSAKGQQNQRGAAAACAGRREVSEHRRPS